MKYSLRLTGSNSRAAKLAPVGALWRIGTPKGHCEQGFRYRLAHCGALEGELEWPAQVPEAGVRAQEFKIVRHPGAAD